MSTKSGKIKRDIIPICLFCFLIGVFIIIILNKQMSVIKDYVPIFQSQIKSNELNKNSVFISVMYNRVALYVVVYLYSLFYRGRYNIHILSAVFFMFYGMFFTLNLIALGVKGLLPAILLWLPQWILYLLSFYVCIHQNRVYRSSFNGRVFILRIIPIIILLVGILLETYVTQPLLLKIF